MAFHEVRFPTRISLGAIGGPERRTDVVALGSGFEERNARWADSRRSYNAGYGVATLDDLTAVIAFFEERRGRLHGFRWKDHADFKSCAASAAPAPLDQVIGMGTGALTQFQLRKTYGSAFAPWQRAVKKPVAGTVSVAVAGVTKTIGAQFTIDATSGVVTFAPGQLPGSGQTVTAGFEFDVPVRFDADKLDVTITGFKHGAMPAIPIVEIRL